MWDIPNVKSNHPEKTEHPCQFPIELVERCVLALTNEGSWVLDPLAGVGSTVLGAIRNNHNALGIKKEKEYCKIVNKRIKELNPILFFSQRNPHPQYQPVKSILVSICLCRNIAYPRIRAY